MKIDPDRILTIYLGVPEKCMCGCSGDYAYNPLHVDFAGKNRGYPVTPDEVKPRSLKARLKRFLSDESRPQIIPERNGHGIILTKYVGEVGDKQITIYMMPKGK